MGVADAGVACHAGRGTGQLSRHEPGPEISETEAAAARPPTRRLSAPTPGRAAPTPGTPAHSRGRAGPRGGAVPRELNGADKAALPRGFRNAGTDVAADSRGADTWGRYRADYRFGRRHRGLSPRLIQLAPGRTGHEDRPPARYAPR